jgi:hypothetical protein
MNETKTSRGDGALEVTPGADRGRNRLEEIG